MWMFWLEGALESGKCYRTCRFWQQCAEHTIVLLRAHKGLRGCEKTKDSWAYESTEKKRIIGHIDHQIIKKLFNRFAHSAGPYCRTVVG